MINKMGTKEVSDFRRRRKENLIRVCGNSCAICGYHKSKSALEFHHIDASKKNYGIAANGTCHSLEKDLNEVKKCILVCANCHREIHDGDYTQEKLYEMQIFDNDYAHSLKEAKEKKFYFCQNCGKELSQQGITGLCNTCFQQYRKQGRPDRETLKQLIRTKPFTHIGNMFGVSDNAIRKWCKAENLPSKKSDILVYSDEQWTKI